MNIGALRRAGWAAAAILPLVPLAFFFFDTAQATLPFKLTIAVLLALGTWRPWTAFGAALALMPVAPMLSLTSGSHVYMHAAVDTLALTALFAWCRLRIGATPVAFSAWRAFALVLAASAVASVAAQFALDASLGSADRWNAFLAWLPRYPFDANPIAHPIYAAAPLVLGAALAVAVVDFTRGDASRLLIAARIIVAGATAAAAVNVVRFVQIVDNAGQPLSSLGRRILEARIDAQLNDVNATGPYLAMVCPIAMGLAVAEPRRRLLWIPCAAIVATAVWLSGSRSALATAVLASVAVAFVLGNRRARLAWIGAVAAVLVAGIVIAPQRMRLDTLQKGVTERVQYAQTSLRMFATAPAFGVGIGRYWYLSNEFAPPELIATWPEATPHENAHNNYLQVLAELGLVGFAAFCGVLAWPFLAGRRGESKEVLHVAVAAGVAGMLLAFLATHPLLVRPIAYMFFAVLGLLMALRPSKASKGTATLLIKGTATLPEKSHENAARAGKVAVPLLFKVAVPLICVGVLASVPFQARRARDTVDLENVTIGTSRWQPELDGERFVMAPRTARVFVDSRSKGAVLPLRLPRGGSAARDVSIYLDGKLANAVRVRTDGWTYAVVVLPEGRQRYRAVDLVVEGELVPGDHPHALVFIGRFRTVERR